MTRRARLAFACIASVFAAGTVDADPHSGFFSSWALAHDGAFFQTHAEATPHGPEGPLGPEGPWMACTLGRATLHADRHGPLLAAMDSRAQQHLDTICTQPWIGT